MTKYQCNSCLGTYDADQEGGYYHVCPPNTKNPRDENIDDREPGKMKQKDKEERIKLKGKGRKEIVVRRTEISV